MKKRAKIILLIATAVLVIAVGAGLVFAAPMLAMKPAQTGVFPGTDNLNVIALRSGRGNLYLANIGAGWLMIDAGANADSVEAGLAELGIDPAQIKAILLTHTHGDHVAALPLFPDAEVYLSEGETPPATAPQAIKLLKGGEKLLFGNVEVECIAAPGHTSGSMLYNIRAKDMERSHLFSGDALRWSNGRMSVHPFTSDKAQAEKTIAALPGAWMILTSHYGWFYPPIP